MKPPGPRYLIRWLLPVLGLALVLGLAGCQKKVVIKTPQPQPEQPQKVQPTGPALLAQAAQALGRERYGEARAGYGDYLKLFPQGPQRDQAVLGLGLAALGLKDYPAARDSFNQHLAAFPESPNRARARLGLAQALNGLNLPLRALESLIGLKADEEPPEIRSGYYILQAEARFKLGQPKSALDALVRGYDRAEPGQTQVYIDALNRLAGQWPEQTLVDLTKLYPDPFPTAYLVAALADRALAQQNWGKALKYQHRLLEDFPNLPLTQAKTKGLNWANLPPGKEWTIGCLLPLSGPLAQYGQKLLEGMQLAAGVFNSDSPFKLIIEDTANDPLVTSEAMDRLAMSGDAVAVVGPLSARLAKVAGEKAGQLQVPLITLTQNRQVNRLNPWTLRDFITPEDLIDALAKRAVEDLFLAKVAILYPELSYGHRMRKLMTEAVERYGGQVVATRSYPADSVDLAEQLLALGGTAPDSRPQPDSEGLDKQGPAFQAMFIPDGVVQAAQIAPQLAFYNLTDVVLLGTNLWHDPELIRLAKDYVQGALIPTSFFPTADDPVVRSFVRRFTKTYGHAPELFAALGYDAVRLVVDVITHQGIDERPALLKALLATNDYPGVTGLTRFNQQGEAVKEPYVVTVKGNSFVLAPQWPEPETVPGELPPEAE